VTEDDQADQADDVPDDPADEPWESLEARFAPAESMAEKGDPEQVHDRTEAEIHGPLSIGGSYKGPDSLQNIAHLGLPPMLSLVGLGGLIALFLANRPWWAAVGCFVAGQTLALVYWRAITPKPTDEAADSD
jgi:hypothetical protein